MKNLRKVSHCKDKQIQNLRSKLRSVTQSDGIKLDNVIHHDIIVIMNRHKDKYPEEDNSFVSIFWNQQLKSASLSNVKSICWHPSMVSLSLSSV